MKKVKSFLLKTKLKGVGIVNYDSNQQKWAYNKEKPSVVSSPIMQAIMDISSHILHQSSLIPEADIQRIGRCCRFGEIIK